MSGERQTGNYFVSTYPPFSCWTEDRVTAARERALKAYESLYSLLDTLGVLTGDPPLGGSETDAPEPAPLGLPNPAYVRTVVDP